MAEQKDMCSSPPGRASKSKLAVEQPSTEGHWNLPKKDTPCPKTKKKLQQDGWRGTITIKSNPIPTRCVTLKLENNNTKEVLPPLWRFWTPCKAPSLGIWQKDWESPGNWRPAGFDYKTSTGLGETDSRPGGHKQNLAYTRLRGKQACR